jgi:hypothetical protein
MILDLNRPGRRPSSWLLRVASWTIPFESKDTDKPTASSSKDIHFESFAMAILETRELIVPQRTLSHCVRSWYEKPPLNLATLASPPATLEFEAAVLF